MAAEVFSIREFALQRDIQKTQNALTQYFVSKNNEEKTWQLMSLMLNSFHQEVFSKQQLQKIVRCLMVQYDISFSALEHAVAFIPKLQPQKEYARKDTVIPLAPLKKECPYFNDIYIILQNALQNGCIDYKQALTLVLEANTFLS